MFPLQAHSACSYSTWHPQVLLLKKIPLTSPVVQPCQCWSSILRSFPVVVVSRPHCHRLNWALCNRPLHLRIPIKTLKAFYLYDLSIVRTRLLWHNLKIDIILIGYYISSFILCILCIINIRPLISS